MLLHRCCLRTASAIAAALSIASVNGVAKRDSTWRDHERALRRAGASKDTVAYRAQLAAEYRAVGATPRIAARFASLALDARDTAAAGRWMRTLAAMGTELDSTLMAQYGTLAGARAVASVRAMGARATRNVGSTTVAFRIPDVDMIPEDIAYDPDRERFLVSSVHHGGVYLLSARGRLSTLLESGADRSWGMFALGVDTATNVLWATTSALSMAAHYVPGDSGRSALLKYDLRTGTLRGRYVTSDTGAHALGDLVVASSGTVFVSDGLGSGVYVHASGDTDLERLVPPGEFLSPQTPALSSDGKTLFVPDYAIGIAAVDIATGKVAWVTHSDSLALTGIDGMYRIGRDLIVVQNGLEPNRVMRLTLDDSMRRVMRAEALVRGPAARELSHAAMLNGWMYYITKSGWDRVADDGSMRAGTAGDAPVIARLRIVP